MVDRWDNIEILQAIDRRQQETYRGGPMRGVNGLHLMEQITGVMVHEPQLVRGFVQELSHSPRPGAAHLQGPG